jgi:hypothetical protein
MKLLAAAAIALPTAIAGAQTPLTATASDPRIGRHAPTRPARHPATPTANTATEDTRTRQASPAAAEQAADPVDANAEPGTQGEVTSQAAAQPPTPSATPQPPQPAPAQAQAAAATQAQPAAAGAQAEAATEPQPAPAQAPAQTPGQAQTQAAAGATVLATAADVRAGVAVRDQSGGLVGTIESVDASGAVVATGTARAKLPLASFGRNDQGLVISLTKAQLEAAARQAQPAQPSAG